MAEAKLKRTELGQLIARVDQAFPRASLLYARLILVLLDAPDRTMALADLSDAIGKGRDSSAVQAAAARLETIGILRRDLNPAEDSHGRSYAVRLLR